MEHIFWIVGLVAVGGVIYLAYKRGDKVMAAKSVASAAALPESSKLKVNIPVAHRKVVDGIVQMADVVGWFRSQQLKKGVDTPFVARPEAFDVEPAIAGDKKCNLILGVFNDSRNNISNTMLLQADGFDAKLAKLLDNKTLVVLQ